MDASRRSVIFHADERGFAYSESVWSWHPWAGANPRVEEPRGDGDSEVMDTGESTP
jgi:hypothetical protein